MSDSDESGVTHTEISSLFEGLSDIGSPGVVALQAPPSPDYIPGPEEPQSPPLPDFVPKPIYPEYMPQEDEVFSAEEQPLPAAASPTAQSPDYVPESDPEADPEEDDNEEPAEDPVDYPADIGDDGDDEDESSEDDEDDDEVDIEADDDEEEEEHPAPADSVVVALPAADQAPSAEETEPFETDESCRPQHHLLPAYRVTAKILFPLSITLGPAYEVRESSSAAAAKPARGLTVDYGFVATMDREIRRDLERDVGYGITDSWDEIVETLQGAPVSTDTELGRHMTAFETRVRQDTDEIYTRLDDEQSGRQLLAGRLNMLFRDRRAHARTARLMETEARIDAGNRSQEAEAAHRGTEADKETSDPDGRKMAPKRAMRSNIAQETTNTTSVTNAQLQEMINQGVTATLAARDANTNGIDNHNSGTGARRNERATRECMEMDIQEKDNNQSQNDKTEQENGKSVKEKSSQSQTSNQVKVNPGKWIWKDAFETDTRIT
ncbi:hypothetical protein Tco_1272066 [Tanacetum coccineum]